MKPKIYEVDLENSEVYAISLVEFPAIEEEFIALSKDKKQPILLMNDERHMIYGAVLKPDFPIYRYDDIRGEYYIKFSRPTIEHLAQEFMKRQDRSMTLDHETDTNKVDVVESWIKEDNEYDKSVALGLGNLPIGSWIIGCKVNDENIWQSIKNGERNGFSIESLCELNEINFNKMTNKEQLESVVVSDSFWDKLKQIIADALGTSTEEPIVEEIADVAEAEAKIDEIKEPVLEEMEEKTEPAIEQMAEVVEEQPQEDDKQAKIDELTKENEALKEEIDNLKKELETLKGDNANLQAENEKLSKQPSTEPIKVEASKNNNKSFLDFAKGIYKI